MVAKNTDYRGDPVRPLGAEVHTMIEIRIRRCPDRSRDGRPEGVMAVRCAQESRSWLNFDAAKIVVLDFRSEHQGEPAVGEAPLILEEAAEQQVRTLRLRDRIREAV